MDAKEEVRSRLNIEDVIGEYVQLKRAGRNWRGLSPFTSERTPSFYVSPDKNIWHDFSSGKGGDVFSFVMEAEGLDFRQTLELLARKASVDLSLYDSPANQGLADRKKRLLKLLELATRFYQQSLLKNQHALEYVFKNRKINKTTAQDFKLGYAPQSFDGLIKILKKHGFSDAEIKAAGWRSGDMFRGRMIIPLCDATGQVVGFTARQISDDKKSPKYINTSSTLLYDKGRQVFGLHQAKEAIRKADKAVIVEGNMDVISSHQAGVKNVVAAAGTALTENHIRVVARLTRNLALAFDGDAAGLKATERAIALAQKADVELSVVSLPSEAKDPDELIKSGPAAWQAAIDKSRPAVDWLIERYSSLNDITSASGKKTVTNQTLSIIKSLADPVEQEHYLQVLADLLKVPKSALTTKMRSENHDQKRFKNVKSAEVILPSITELYQNNLLALCLFDVDVRDALRHLKANDVAGPDARAVLQFLQTNSNQPLSDELPKALQPYEVYVKILLLTAETRYGEWNSQDRYLEAAKLVRQIKSEQTKLTKNQLINELRNAEQAGDNLLAEQLRAKLNALIKQNKGDE